MRFSEVLPSSTKGASFIANEGLNAMDSASLVDQSAVFGTLGGGKTRYDTGSRVDVDCMSPRYGACHARHARVDGRGLC